MPRTVLLAFASLLVLAPLRAGLAGAAEPVRPAAASEVPAAADVRRHLDAALAEATQVSRKTAVTAAFGEYVALSRTLPASRLEQDKEIKRLFHALSQAVASARDGSDPRLKELGGELERRLDTLAPAAPKPAEVMGDVPPDRQATMLLRALSYNANLLTTAGTSLVMAVINKPGHAGSEKTAEAMAAAFSRLESTTVQGLPFRVRRTPFTGAAALEREIQVQGIDVLYVCGALDGELPAIEELSRKVKVLTIGGRGEYIEQGLSLGVFASAGHVSINLNLDASRREGAAFTTDLLRIARVVRASSP
jgi:hypothetical protein